MTHLTAGYDPEDVFSDWTWLKWNEIVSDCKHNMDKADVVIGLDADGKLSHSAPNAFNAPCVVAPICVVPKEWRSNSRTPRKLAATMAAHLWDAAQYRHEQLLGYHGPAHA